MFLMTHGALPMLTYDTLAEGITRGRQRLVELTHQDFCFDLKAWHDRLARTKSYNYRSIERPGVYPKSLLDVLHDPDWIAAVEFAEQTQLFDKLVADDAKMRQATADAERRWAGRDRFCPKCGATFHSVGDRGQCPVCYHTFFVSHPDGDPDWWRDDG
ncbi:hypothetical protein [Novipirellula maiorica]|uniref:hypothetical protein n=1 Tax=Novipirellula maiorica TaxID=1265734 RepID=UPI0011819F59|nr:hypothetical protein [Rhodopirellula maiorica]